MSSHRPKPKHAVIRRSPRQSTVTELPVAPERPEAPHIGRNAKIYALSLLAVVVIGAIFLATPLTSESGNSTSFIDAFFTSVSASAVTGLVTVDTQEHWNFWGELVILALIQAGGLGFMVGASLILQTLRRGQTNLSDSILIYHGAPTVSLREASSLTGRIPRFTIVVEGAGALLLTASFARDMPFHEALWHGVFHSISAFCNAGFDLQGGFRSLAGQSQSAPVNIVVMLLIQAGALSYMVLEDVVHKRSWRRLALDTKIVLVINAGLLIGGFVLFLAAEWNRSLADMDGWAKPMGAMFQSVAARTAGFASVNIGAFHAVTLFAWVGIMMVGGASGSTAGGVKLSTFGVILAAIGSTLRGREDVHLFGRRLETTLIFRAMAVVGMFLIVHFSITLVLIYGEHREGASEANFLDLMFEAMSAPATVGLTTGITPSLTTLSKIALCAAMFFGRLGPLTAVYALQRRQRPVRYRLPAAPVRIG